MNRLFAGLFLATAWLDAHAQSSLRPCPMPFSTTTWTNCFGTVTWGNGSKYVGEWRDDKYHGQGAYTYADGSKYVGEYRDDKRKGQGIEYAANGTIKLAGLWANNTLSRAYAIDASRFPLNAVSDVATATDSGDKVFRLERNLAAAEERIKSLESELARAREASKSPSVESGLSLVTKCLKEGLRPGTPEFSKCVASRSGVP